MPGVIRLILFRSGHLATFASTHFSTRCVVTALDDGLSGVPDPGLIAWASREYRLILINDRRTMPNHAAAQMTTGKSVAGIIVVPRRLPIKQVIDDLRILRNPEQFFIKLTELTAD